MITSLFLGMLTSMAARPCTLENGQVDDLARHWLEQDHLEVAIMQSLQRDCITTHARRRSITLASLVAPYIDAADNRLDVLKAVLYDTDGWEQWGFHAVGLTTEQIPGRPPEAVAEFLYRRASMRLCHKQESQEPDRINLNPIFGRKGAEREALAPNRWLSYPGEWHLVMGRQSVSRTDWMRSVFQVRRGEIPIDDNIEGIWSVDANRMKKTLPKIEAYNEQLAAVLGITEADWMPYLDTGRILLNAGASLKASVSVAGIPVSPQLRWWILRCGATES